MAGKEEVVEAVVDAVEKTADVVEETLETVERIPNLRLNGTTRKQQIIILAATALVSGGVAGAVTYLVTKKKLETKFEQIAKQEIAEAKRYYSILNKKDEFSDPISALKNVTEEPEQEPDPVERYNEEVARLQYTAEDGTLMMSKLQATGPEQAEADEKIEEAVEVVEEASEEVVNIFSDSGEDFDYEAEVLERRNGVPYIITHDEFYENDNDFQQTTLTYFEGDDVLVDERESPIRDTNGTVGDDSLTRFGAGSKDKNVVYVRNEKLEMDFEIVRSNGHYVREVLGFIEHSDRPRGLRKFRGDDM